MIIHSDYPFPVSKYFPEDGMELAYVDVGSADTSLVFLHGFTSYIPAWTKNIQVLKKHYRCLALDLPGHGLSTLGDYPYTMAFYAEYVKKWLLHLPYKEPKVLIAHSMGGQIAIRLALENPSLFSHLILVAPAGFETFTAQESYLLEQFASQHIMNASQYLNALLDLKNYFGNVEEKEYERLKKFSRHFYNLRDNPNMEKMLGRSVKGMVEAPVFDELKKLAMPTLVFFGLKDKMIPNRFLHKTTTAEIAQAGSAQIPQSALKLYPNSGHYLQYEEASHFNMDVYKFLNPEVFEG